MSVNTHNQRPFTNVDDLISELKHEMLYVTTEEFNPWWPVGGSFGLSYSRLPDSAEERERIAEAVKNAFNDPKVFPVASVDISDDGHVCLTGDRSKLA